jgi:hypothetical protein
MQTTTNWLRGIAGAVIGGALGYAVFFALARQGFYAMVLPGALLGLGCGLLSGTKSMSLGVVCAVLGLALGIYTEWRFAPFKADDSLTFFITHLFDLNNIKLIMIAVGALAAGWFGLGRERYGRRSPGGEA